MIKTIDRRQTQEIIATREPLGQFIYHDLVADVYVAIDNTDGYAWTEDFNTVHKAKYWLKKG